ncbi:MAG: hypothetical protein ACKOTB_10250, partial [Planctomycetia bacterium]
TLRRLHVDPHFPVRADHLTLPGRLLSLRRAAADAARRTRLDRVVDLIIAGELARAGEEVATLEAP